VGQRYIKKRNRQKNAANRTGQVLPKTAIKFLETGRKGLQMKKGNAAGITKRPTENCSKWGRVDASRNWHKLPRKLQKMDANRAAEQMLPETTEKLAYNGCKWVLRPF
jgi:hypothetical protein